MSVLLLLMPYLMLDGLALFHKGDFHHISGILDGACHFRDDLYLNSTTIPLLTPHQNENGAR